MQTDYTKTTTLLKDFLQKNLNCTAILDKWVIINGNTENYNKAKSIIIECIKNSDENLNLSGLMINTLPPLTILKKLKHVKELNLSNNSIQVLDVNLFNTLDNLKILNLNQNSLFEIKPNIFINLTKLERLYINDNKIMHELKPEMFKGLYSLRELDLSNNKIKKIKPKTFDNLPNLKVLNLSNNQITDINPQTFNLKDNNLINLTRIVLDDNPINLNKLNTNIFNKKIGIISTLTQLKYQVKVLDDSNNNIVSSLSYFIQHKVDLLKSWIKLNENNFELGNYKEACSRILECIKNNNPILNLSNLKLANLPHPDVFFELSHITELELSNNNLKTMKSKVFNNLVSLQNLNLSNNRLCIIKPKTFNNLTNLQKIDLSNNDLEKIELNTFNLINNNLINLELIDLSNNQIDFDYLDNIVNASNDYLININSKIFDHSNKLVFNIIRNN